jgi:hypothetical protein
MWGFTNLGRFAAAYRSRFGIRPLRNLAQPGTTVTGRRQPHPLAGTADRGQSLSRQRAPSSVNESVRLGLERVATVIGNGSSSPREHRRHWETHICHRSPVSRALCAVCRATERGGAAPAPCRRGPRERPIEHIAVIPPW